MGIFEGLTCISGAADLVWRIAAVVLIRFPQTEQSSLGLTFIYGLQFIFFNILIQEKIAEHVLCRKFLAC